VQPLGEEPEEPVNASMTLGEDSDRGLEDMDQVS